MKVQITLTLILLSISFSFAQSGGIKGTINNHSQTPLMGINVLAKSSNQGIQTDENGNRVGQRLLPRPQELFMQFHIQILVCPNSYNSLGKYAKAVI